MPELKLSVIQDNVAERSEAIDISELGEPINNISETNGTTPKDVSELGEPINNITAEQSDQRPVLT